MTFCQTPYWPPAARHVALNPVRPQLVARAEEWRWSSARTHLDERDDGRVTVRPLLDRCGGRIADLIDAAASVEALSGLRAAETTGRPLGSDAFLGRLPALV